MEWWGYQMEGATKSVEEPAPQPGIIHGKNDKGGKEQAGVVNILGVLYLFFPHPEMTLPCSNWRAQCP